MKATLKLNIILSLSLYFVASHATTFVPEELKEKPKPSTQEAKTQEQPTKIETPRNDSFVDAARRGDIAAIRKMVVFENANINSIDAQGDTALHVAIKENKKNVIDLFIDNKIFFVEEITDPNTSFLTMLLFSIHAGAQKLNLNQTNNDGYTPLLLAEKANLTEVVKLLKPTAIKTKSKNLPMSQVSVGRQESSSQVSEVKQEFLALVEANNQAQFKELVDSEKFKTTHINIPQIFNSDNAWAIDLVYAHNKAVLEKENNIKGLIYYAIVNLPAASCGASYYSNKVI